jgi:hypothetical protein
LADFASISQLYYFGSSKINSIEPVFECGILKPSHAAIDRGRGKRFDRSGAIENTTSITHADDQALRLIVYENI